MLGMLIWAVTTNHGAGRLAQTGISVTGNTLSWNTVYGLQAIIGVYGTGCLGQSGETPLIYCLSNVLRV